MLLVEILKRYPPVSPLESGALYNYFILIFSILIFTPLSIDDGGIDQREAGWCLENQVSQMIKLIMEISEYLISSNQFTNIIDRLNGSVGVLDGRYSLSSNISCSDAKGEYLEALEDMEQLELEAKQLRKTEGIDANLQSIAFPLFLVVPAIATVITVFLIEIGLRLNYKNNVRITSSLVEGESKKTRNRIIVVTICSLMIFSLLFYVAMNPKQGEQFYALSLLDPNLKAQQYYPSEEGVIRVGENVHWFIDVSSHSSSVKLLKLTVGIGIPSGSASTFILGNDTDMLVNYHRVMYEGEQWLLPLNWNVTSTSIDQDGKLQICTFFNGIVRQPTVVSKEGKNFRVVIGLWSFEPDLSEYKLVSWLQVWFNIPNSLSENNDLNCA